MSLSKPRQLLLNEIKSVEAGKIEKGEAVDYSALYEHITDDGYPNEILEQELTMLKLGFFAKKLKNKVYDTLAISKPTEED